MDLSTGNFSPSQRVKDEIEAQGSKGLDVRVAAKGLTAEGLVKIRADNAKNYDSVGKGSMPLLNPWTQQLGGMHVNFAVANGEIVHGYASLKPRGGDTNDWVQALQKTSDALGGLGLKVGHLPTPINKFEGGKLTLGVSNLKVEVGGFVDALFNVSVENMSEPKIDASADVDIKGLVKGQLQLNNTSGKLAGQVALSINYKAFNGEATVVYKEDGSVDVSGKAAYSADKLSGEIQFVATDLPSAESFTKNAIAAAGGKENVQAAGPPAPVPAPKEGQKKRALAATGQLAFNLTKWFAGTVNVVVDAKGAITVIGKIAPPAEIELFKQRDWDKELIKFEAKAYYGIPVVGNLNLFANIGLHAIAKLGPAKIYNIEILGTYSTDPEVQKSIQISGSINISAYAGLRLRAEGGVGIEILSHDLKFGIGINVDVGVKAYADARPTIGYRDPGVFYISGTLDLVAQPVLGLGGEFFIAIETPWWSPLSDDKWTWPLFSKEWPLTNPIGISAAVKDYELGSGKVPEIELKPPEFDPSKFMTSMVDKTLPDKSSGAGAGQGTFKEDGTVQKPVVPPKKPAPKQSGSKPAKKGAPLKGGKSASPDTKASKEQQGGKILQGAAKPLAALKTRGAMTRSELDKELAKIKAQVGAIEFSVQAKGEKWVVLPKAGGRTAKAVEVAAKQGGDLATAKFWNERRTLSAADEHQHNLYFKHTGETGILLLASDARPVTAHLQDVIDDASFPDATRNAARKALKFYQDNIQPVIGKPITAPTKNEQALIKDLPANLTSFSQSLMHIGEGGIGDLPKSATWSYTPVPKTARVELLSFKGSRGGSDASGNPKGWPLITERGLGAGSRWVKMHLITAGIGGHGQDKNLLPAPGVVNTGGVVRGFETQLEAMLYGKKKASDVHEKPSVFRSLKTPTVIWVQVGATGYHPAYSDPTTAIQLYDSTTFASSVQLQSGIHYFRNNAWVKDPTQILNRSTILDKPDFTGELPNFNSIGRPTMISITGISGYMADQIIAVRGGKPFDGYPDLVKRLTDYRNAQNIPDSPEFKAAKTAIFANQGKFRFK